MYLKIKKEMMTVLQWFDEEHAGLRKKYEEAGKEEERVSRMPRCRSTKNVIHATRLTCTPPRPTAPP